MTNTLLRDPWRNWNGKTSKIKTVVLDLPVATSHQKSVVPKMLREKLQLYTSPLTKRREPKSSSLDSHRTVIFRPLLN
ncbi:unnamed protein product [Linum tenue]|uniref:Uncharacterized protein n=1 Tax=Linum tenue TaxID=586396 RepID=A0AAV0RZE5_9ROSI|nr:unnamed protein product [Linum tenue]